MPVVVAQGIIAGKDLDEEMKQTNDQRLNKVLRHFEEQVKRETDKLNHCLPSQDNYKRGTISGFSWAYTFLERSLEKLNYYEEKEQGQIRHN